MPASYNLQAELHLRQVNATQALAAFQRQLAATPFNITVQLNQAAATKAASNVQQAMTGATNSVKQFASAQSQTATSSSSLAQSHIRLASSFSAVNNASVEARRNFAQYFRDISTVTGSVLSLHSGLVQLEKAWKSTLAMQADFVQLSQIESRPLNSSANKSMESTIRDTSIAKGVQSADLMKGVIELSQAGWDDTKIKGFMNTLADLSLNKQVKSMREMTDSIILLDKTYGMGADDISKALGAIIGATKSYAITVGEIDSVLKRSGSIFKTYKQDVQSLVAVATAVTENTRLPSGMVSTGMNSAMNRLYAMPQAKKEAARLGVDAYDGQGNIKPMISTLAELAKALDKVSDSERNHSMYLLFGQRNLSVATAMLKTATKAQEIYDAEIRAGSTIVNDSAIAQAGYASQMTKVSESYLRLVASLTNNTAFSSLLSTVLQLAGAFARLAPQIAANAAAVGMFKVANGVGTMFGNPNQGDSVATYMSGGQRATPLRNFANNAGAFIARNKTMLGYATSLGLMAGADAMGEQDSQAGIAGQAIMSGAGNGLMAGTMTGNPIVGGVVGVVSALAQFTTGLQKAQERLDLLAVTKAAGQYATSVAQTKNPLSPDSIERFGQLYDKSMERIDKARNNQDAGFWKNMAHPFTPNFKLVDNTELIEKAQDEVRQQTMAATLAERDSIIEVTKTFEEFKAYGGKLGSQVLALGAGRLTPILKRMSAKRTRLKRRLRR